MKLKLATAKSVLANLYIAIDTYLALDSVVLYTIVEFQNLKAVVCFLWKLCWGSGVVYTLNHVADSGIVPLSENCLLLFWECYIHVL